MWRRTGSPPRRRRADELTRRAAREQDGAERAELTVRVEARPRSASAEDRMALTARLRERLKDSLGVSCGVDVVEPACIQRSAGKARRIVDLRSI